MEKTKTRASSRTLNMVLCAMFAALITVGAFIKIPIPYVPVTLQLFFTTLAGLLLGPKWGAASSLLYMITGLVGIPIFTGGGGIGYIFKPSFGYIIGFVFGSFLTGFISSRGEKQTYLRNLIAALSGVLVVYVFGVIYYYMISNFYLNTGATVKTVFLYCFLLLIPGDIAFSFLAAFLSQRLSPVMKKLLNR